MGEDRSTFMGNLFAGGGLVVFLRSCSATRLARMRARQMARFRNLTIILTLERFQS
jgi:hypothetical protein